MPINHFYLLVPKARMATMIDWYTKALAPINYQVRFNLDSHIAMAPKGGYPDFWLRAYDGDSVIPTHVCFDTRDQAAVDRFHQEAIAAGGTSNGAPGIRSQMSVQPYYAAYVIDPEGNNIEVTWLGDDWAGNR